MLMVGGFVGMNLLSGVTWKGAQLRLGEAKPDFRERCVSHALFQHHLLTENKLDDLVWRPNEKLWRRESPRARSVNCLEAFREYTHRTCR